MAKDIIVTLPKTVKWEDYQQELKDVEEKGLLLNFKVPSIPNHIEINTSKCYLTHNGIIKGWMLIVNTIESKMFKCETTGKIWKGSFIVRSGKFHPIRPILYKGFQGYRYFNL